MFLKKIGSGGTSQVYLAADKRSGERYAVKVYDREKDFQDAEKERNLLLSLNHKSIPHVREVIWEKEKWHVVMEYVPGVSLKEVLGQERIIGEEEAVKWGRELCDVLAYLHWQNPRIIYRDLKPGNIIIMPLRTTKLIDFGAALCADATQKAINSPPMGTVGYAPPEQFEAGRALDKKTDIYAFGATLYHMVTGIRPNRKEFPFRPVRKIQPKLSKKLENIIMCCVEREPANRYSFFEEIQMDLRTVSESTKKGLFL